MQVEIKIPRYARKPVKKTKHHFPKNLEIIACDVETYQNSGEPYLLTLYDGQKDARYIETNRETIALDLFKYLLEKCNTKKDKSYAVFFHNLAFDLTAIMTAREQIFRYAHPPRQTIKDENGKLLGWIQPFAYKIWFAQIVLKNGIRLKFIDTGNFIQGSLYTISRDLKFEHKKPNRPLCVSSVEGKLVKCNYPNCKYKGEKGDRECSAFRHYVQEEIYAEHELAQYIVDNMWKPYDVNVSISSSQYSAKVFTKSFIEEGEQIPRISIIPLHQMIIESLHGGRASTFPDEEGIRIIPNVTMYDYSSFYPWALANLPPLTKGKWKQVERFNPDYEGFYRITGYIRECKYPVIIKTQSKMVYANGERVVDLAIASYELREALNSDELELEKCEGWIWIPSTDSRNPFKNYAYEFYKLKSQTNKTHPFYLTYKLLLNQLYGKTYQKTPDKASDRLPDNEAIWRKGQPLNKVRRVHKKFEVGSLWLPHVGAWITSMCRAKLHQMLHQVRAVDCATDSFKTKLKIDELPSSEITISETLELNEALQEQIKDLEADKEYQELCLWLARLEKTEGKIVERKGIEIRKAFLITKLLSSLIDQKDFQKEVRKESQAQCYDLGKLSIVANGIVLLFRPKLYVMFSKEIETKLLKEHQGDLRAYLNEHLDELFTYNFKTQRYYPDRTKIVRYAVHGFWGSVKQLLELYRDRKTEYEIMHMVKQREALRQRKKARVMEKQTRKLKIDYSEERGWHCGLPIEVAKIELDMCTGKCGGCAYWNEDSIPIDLNIANQVGSIKQQLQEEKRELLLQKEQDKIASYQYQKQRERYREWKQSDYYDPMLEDPRLTKREQRDEYQKQWKKKERRKEKIDG